MLNKKWTGVVAASIVVSGAVQSCVGCADIYSILSNLKGVRHYFLGEFVKYILRITRDFSVAESLAKRMFTILKSRNKGEEERIIKALKIFSNIDEDLDFSEKTIVYLIEKIKKPGINFAEEGKGLELINYLISVPVIDKGSEESSANKFSSFLNEKDLLRKLLSYRDNNFSEDYEDYSKKMEEIEKKVKKYATYLNALEKVKYSDKTGSNTIILKKLRKLLKETNENISDEAIVEKVVNLTEKELMHYIINGLAYIKNYYANPNGWVRYLATLGFFIDKNSFPTEENDYHDILLKYYFGSAIPGAMLNTFFDLLTSPFGIGKINPVNILAAPYMDKTRKKITDYKRYDYLNHDKHLRSLSTMSAFDNSSILDVSTKDYFLGYIKEIFFQGAKVVAGNFFHQLFQQ